MFLCEIYMLKCYSDWVLENFNSNLTLCHAGKELLLTELGNPVFKTIQKLSKVLNVFNKVTGKINITKVKANNSTQFWAIIDTTHPPPPPTKEIFKEIFNINIICTSLTTKLWFSN